MSAPMSTAAMPSHPRRRRVHRRAHHRRRDFRRPPRRATDALGSWRPAARWEICAEAFDDEEPLVFVFVCAVLEPLLPAVWLPVLAA